MSTLTEEEGEALLKTYAACLDNATQLLAEAELLLEHRQFARAYMLAFTALEEVSKSQLVADLFTGYIEQDEFRKSFSKHSVKSSRIVWALDSSPHLDEDEPEQDSPLLNPQTRMASLYVDIDDKLRPLLPESRLNEGYARDLIRAVNQALWKIAEKEFMGERIGTRGFMK